MARQIEKRVSGKSHVVNAVIAAAEKLREQSSELDFSQITPWVYNPLDYAWSAHEQFARRYSPSQCRVLFLGMNPGPWGMAQTGVPFGEVAAVVEWLRIDAQVGRPSREHPKRPIEGLVCKRSEVSGRRLWGLFREKFGTPKAFFEEHYVANYCPLVFMQQSAANVTPDKLPSSQRQPLERICDEHLLSLIHALRPQWVIGVGAWAESCAQRVVAQAEFLAPDKQLATIKTGRILHPSPASPAANRDWSGTVTGQLQALGIW